MFQLSGDAQTIWHTRVGRLSGIGKVKEFAAKPRNFF